MRIGYDEKRTVQNFTRLGNYSRYVVHSLSAFAPENEYWLYVSSRRENGPLAATVAESGGGRCITRLRGYGLWIGMK